MDKISHHISSSTSSNLRPLSSLSSPRPISSNNHHNNSSDSSSGGSTNIVYHRNNILSGISGRYRDDYWYQFKFLSKLEVVGFSINIEHCKGIVFLYICEMYSH